MKSSEELKETIEEVGKALDEYWRIFKPGDDRAKRAAEHFEHLAVLVTGLVAAVPDDLQASGVKVTRG